MRPTQGQKVLTALALAWLFATGARADDLPVSLGPAPRDDSGRFRNFTNPLPRAGPGVTIPFFARRTFSRLRGTPEGLPVRIADARERLEALWADPDANAVTWINHATLLVRIDGVRVLTDPVWSRAAGPWGRLGARRLVEPGLALENLPEVDVVVISHNHYDSLDLGSLRELARRQPAIRFLVPLGDGELLRAAGIERVEEFDWGDSTRQGPVRIHCLPSQHWSRRGLFDGRRSLWASWAVVGPAHRFFFGGDSGYFEGFAKIGEALGPFDLAALPIGAYEPQAMMRAVHLDPEQAVRVADDVRARRALAMHYGTFDLTDEPVAEPPRRFRAAAGAAGWPADRAWVLDLGETRTF